MRHKKQIETPYNIIPLIDTHVKIDVYLTHKYVKNMFEVYDAYMLWIYPCLSY